MVKDAVGSIVKLQLSDAFPAVSFPFLGAIGAEELSDAIAGVLRLAICFKLGQVRAGSPAFNYFVKHCSERNGLAVCFNADYALAIKRAPGSFTCATSNGKVTATDDRRLFDGSASALDFLAIARIELKAANGTISLDELHADNAAASIEDELLDESGFVHERRHRCLTTREQYRKKAPEMGPVTKLYI